jgi:hypothetical protein
MVGPKIEPNQRGAKDGLGDARLRLLNVVERDRAHPFE